MAKKRGFLTLLLALVMAIGLTVPAWAGVTDVTGDTTSSTYKHTYHTRIVAHADIYANGSKVAEVDYESEFVIGNLSDPAVLKEIEKFKQEVTKYLNDNGLSDLALTSSNTSLTFDHFENSNIMDGNTSENNGETEEGSNTGETLDVHEYQIYQINEVYGTAAPRYYYNSTTAATTADAPQGSPKTFDAGMGIYALSGLLSLGGLTAVVRKRGR